MIDCFHITLNYHIQMSGYVNNYVKYTKNILFSKCMIF
jgi:hypothetical protein